jgi:GTPase
LRLWCNENAGPDGGDGGNGGHVVLRATNDIRDLNQVSAIMKGEPGEKGYPRDCHGKNANHTIVKVPVGTIIKNQNGKVYNL